MGRLLLNWLVSAVSLLIVAHIIPGIAIEGFFTALIAALVIGLVNATLGLVLKILTFPLTIVTLGLFWWIINALMLWFASTIVRGFVVQGFFAAFFGAIVLALVNMLLRWILPSRDEGRAARE
jgi:putative membrane protein